MRSHELAQQLLALPDCEIMVNCYETKLRKPYKAIEVTTAYPYNGPPREYRGEYTNEPEDVDFEREWEYGDIDLTRPTLIIHIT